MRITEFKSRVRAAFGDQLQNATPANVREFLDTLQKEKLQGRRDLQRLGEERADIPYEVPSGTELISWESLIRDFFLQMLEVEQEQAVMLLWVFALELAYAGIEELHSETMERLFQDSAEH